MKILVACQYYNPEQFRINDICPALVKTGNQVTVLTGLPNYPSGRIPNYYKWLRKRKEIIAGVEVIRSFEIGRGNTKIKLALNYLSYMMSASIKAFFLQNDYDVVFVYQLSPITMAIPAIIYKLKHKKKIFLYCQDLWPESLKAMKIAENNPIYKIVHKMCKWIYNKCDYIAVSTKAFSDYLINVNGVTQKKIEYLPQHAEDFYTHVTESPASKEQIDFLFAGNIGKAQNIECILNAVARITTTKKYRVNFVGDGSFLEEAKTLAGKLNIRDRTVFHGRYPLERMAEFYSQADAFLLTLKGGTMISDTIPSKLQGYMAAGKPIFGAINGAANELIKAADCGQCVVADDVDGLKNLMEKFIANPDQYRQFGLNGRIYYLKNFTLEKYIIRLMSILNRLKGENAECFKEELY